MPSKPVYLAVIGTGGVGGVFIQQLLHLLPTYPSISVVLISRSQTCLQSSTYAALSLDSWSASLSRSTSPSLTPQELVGFLSAAPGHKVLVDNTSSQDIANAYPALLSQGISVVTPNKKAFSSSSDLWNAIRAATRLPDAGLCYHESSVGAGLPVISTLNDLLATGDVVERIEGVFSGTMSFLFNSFAPVDAGSSSSSSSSKPIWSAEVRKAQSLGYTEPDPRDDLNGLDVARKLTILARLCGIDVAGPTSFLVQSLIPKPLESVGSGVEFLDRLHEFDHEIAGLRDEADRNGTALRFVGSVDVARGQLKVGLEQVDRSGPIAGLRGADNLIVFYTKRYGERPLVVQGAGAGGEVTAMGVTGDLIKVLQRLN